jgi:hypothetical protein
MASDLAADLMRIGHSFPPAAVGSAGCGYAGKKYAGWSQDLKTNFNANKKLYMVGGIAVLALIVGTVGFALYNKKKTAEDK